MMCRGGDEGCLLRSQYYRPAFLLRRSLSGSLVLPPEGVDACGAHHYRTLRLAAGNPHRLLPLDSQWNATHSFGVTRVAVREGWC